MWVKRGGMKVINRVWVHEKFSPNAMYRKESVCGREGDSKGATSECAGGEISRDRCQSEINLGRVRGDEQIRYIPLEENWCR